MPKHITSQSFWGKLITFLSNCYFVYPVSDNTGQQELAILIRLQGDRFGFSSILVHVADDKVKANLGIYDGVPVLVYNFPIKADWNIFRRSTLGLGNQCC